MTGRFAVVAATGLMTIGVEARSPEAATITAWDAFVARAEHEVHSCQCDETRPEGRTFEVPGGVIHQWRGSVFIRGITVGAAVNALINRGIPPPQDEVLESRVLSRSDGSLIVYLKMSRRALVTVTYDTEHVVTFERLSATSAASRSVATRIEETGGRDRGFLWRLNSYWRYVQNADGVRIEAESLSLSRPVPLLLKPAASPIINRVGRESMATTLDAMRKFLMDVVRRSPLP
jgi:hypothetical protein